MKKKKSNEGKTKGHREIKKERHPTYIHNSQ